MESNQRMMEGGVGAGPCHLYLLIGIDRGILHAVSHVAIGRSLLLTDMESHQWIRSILGVKLMGRHW